MVARRMRRGLSWRDVQVSRHVSGPNQRQQKSRFPHIVPRRVTVRLGYFAVNRVDRFEGAAGPEELPTNVVILSADSEEEKVLLDTPTLDC